MKYAAYVLHLFIKPNSLEKKEDLKSVMHISTFRKQENEAQIRSKVSRRKEILKIREEINDTENSYQQRKSTKAKAVSFCHEGSSHCFLYPSLGSYP